MSRRGAELWYLAPAAFVAGVVASWRCSRNRAPERRLDLALADTPTGHGDEPTP